MYSFFTACDKDELWLHCLVEQYASISMSYVPPFQFLELSCSAYLFNVLSYVYSLLGNLTETTILGLSLYPNQPCEAFEDAR